MNEIVCLVVHSAIRILALLSHSCGASLMLQGRTRSGEVFQTGIAKINVNELGLSS